jgi:hypothetical protein
MKVLSAVAVVVGVSLSPGAMMAQTVLPPAPPFPAVQPLPPLSPVPFVASGQSDPRPRLIPGGMTTTPIPSTDLFRAGPETYSPRADRPLSGVNLPGFVGGYGYLPGAYFASPPFIFSALDVNRSPRERAVGYLRLLVTPASAQIYADGFYVGSVGDVGAAGVELEEGPHRIDLRADGYATLTFDVRVLSNQTVTYRNILERAPPKTAVVAAAPARPKTFYIIPGCYAGDRPPAGTLPAGCDRRKTRQIPPVLSRVSPAP